MPTSSADDWPGRAGSIERCRKLARLLRAGRISFEEYAANVTLELSSALDADFPACIESIPPETADAYADYLRTTLEPVDFMPCPKPFLVGPASEELIERTKRQLRPRYLRLYQMMGGDREPTGRPATGRLGSRFETPA